MKLTITGNVPSQKNRKVISVNRATGRPFLRSHESVKVWQESALIQLQQQFKGFVVTDYPINLNIIIWWDNNRRHDLDNGLSTIMDALAAAGVIEDDSTKYVECITVQYGGVDKENPRAEIYLDE